MQALDQLLNSHHEKLRARGLEYWREGRVRVVRRTSSLILAGVRGTRIYCVVLERDVPGWDHTCTCTAHRVRRQCKHVCALLSELAHAEGARRESDARPRRGTVEVLPAEVEAPECDFDKALERLIADKFLPTERKLTLLENRLQQLLGASSGNEAGELAESESQRTRRLLRALESSTPTFTESPRRICLRYVLSPPPPESASIRLDVHAARVSALGEVGAYRPLVGSPHESDLDEIDRMALALLASSPREERNSHPDRCRAQFCLSPPLQRLLLVGLARAQRLYFAQEDFQSISPLALDKRQGWSFRIDASSAGETIEFEAALEREGERISNSEVLCALGGGFAIARGELHSVDWHGAQAWAAQLCGAKKLCIPKEHRSDLARILASAPLGLPLRAPDLVLEIGGSPKPVLILLAPDESAAQLRAQIEFEYEGERLCRGGPSVVVRGERVLRVQRDAQAESRAEAQFTAAGGKLRAASSEPFDGTLERQRIGALVRALTEQGWLVEGEGWRLRTQSEFTFSVSSDIDWFDLEAKIDFEGIGMELPALLEALERRQFLVRLADGSFGVLPETWLAQWEALALLGEVRQGRLRVKRSRGFLLDILLAERAQLQCDAGFEAFRSRLARAKAPEPVCEPETFAGELRPYQRAGLGWLAFLSEIGLGGCLADDMGLGKTIQVLALILRRKPQARGPTLVVAPKTLLFNWERETQRFAPSLRIRVHHGSERARRPAALEDADVVITTYATLRHDVELLRKLHLDLLVLDEAQTIKNADSQSSKAARLLEADQRLALTGTPIENRIKDLLSIFEFLNPGLLEGSRALRRLLEGGDALETARFAARALRPFILRRTKEEVLTELPQKSEQLVPCELEGTQRREYDAMRDHYRGTLLAAVDEVGIQRAGIHVLTALLRLRQAACHLALIDESHASTRSAKLDALLAMLEELRDSGHKALVFSQFTSFLALVKPELERRGLEYAYLDGKTRDREERVENFQRNAATSVFLISLKAGGVGLNLTAADYVFLLDPWWNPAVERQAIDRTHRIGQTRPVTAYRLVASNTVEEKVLALQDRKRALADALFEGAGSALRELTRADLEAILS
ncbi:MAG TPA: SNF2-related protein [Planctomycetota bacterium]|nr:SNF2-related protein [Planctomycetota bacterium]